MVSSALHVSSLAAGLRRVTTASQDTLVTRGDRARQRVGREHDQAAIFREMAELFEAVADGARLPGVEPAGRGD
jgi:hypothetical protein